MELIGFVNSPLAAILLAFELTQTLTQTLIVLFGFSRPRQGIFFYAALI
jgi:hypothetical protein